MIGQSLPAWKLFGVCGKGLELDSCPRPGEGLASWIGAEPRLSDAEIVARRVELPPLSRILYGKLRSIEKNINTVLVTQVLAARPWLP